jgi:hypothetical protein
LPVDASGMIPAPGLSGRWRLIAAGLLIAGMLTAGIGLHKDYGLSWDEPVQREYGRKVYEYVAHGDPSLLADRHRVYGPAFEILLYSLERGLGLEDYRDIYFMRHLVNFLMYALGVFFFFLLASRMLLSWKLGLLGALMLLLSPRIFAHGFYNSKDIPFMAMFIVCIYTLLIYLDTGRAWTAAVHGFCCGVLIDIRVMGVLVPLITLGFFAYRMTVGGASGPRRPQAAINFGVFCASLVPVTILLWPTLWTGPLSNLIMAFEAMRKFPWEATVLFMGREIWSTHLPPYYTAVWMLITTPVAYTALALIGLVALLRWLPGRNRRAGMRRNALIVLVWLFLPPAFLVSTKAVLYDTWRHTFFVYPAVLLAALIGLDLVLGRVRAGTTGAWSRIAAAAALLVLAAGMAGALHFMVRNHPFENVYFNRLVGGIKGADGKYEMDYWGLSYRQLLESLLTKGRGRTLKVFALNEPGYYNSFLLRPAERGRLSYARSPGAAEYYLTNFRWDRLDLPPGSEFVSVEVEGVTLSAAYRLRGL